MTRRHLRVLTLVDRVDDQGGAERFALALASSLPRDRFISSICSTRPLRRPEETRAWLADRKIALVSLDRRNALDPRVWGLTRLLRRERIDIVHAHMYGSNLWGTILGRLCRVPVIIAHEHNWSYSDDQVRLWLDGHVIGRLATRFVAVSGANRERMTELEGVPPGKIVVMPTAYIASGDSGGVNVRAELGLAAGTPLLAVAARLRPEKALHVLLDAVAMAALEVPDIHLAIAGDGPCRGDLEVQAASLGITERVSFLGLRRDVDAVLATANVGVMSSDWEGMPLFLFECMAAQLPIVATSVGGIPEVVRDGETGLLVPPGDAGALAATLVRVLQDGQLRAKLGAAAAAELDRYTLPSVVERFASLYDTLALEAGLSLEA